MPDAERVFVAPGYVLPGRFTAEVEAPDGLRISIDVEILGGRAIAKRVVLEHERGVSSTYQRIPRVRHIVARECLVRLLKVNPETMGLASVNGADTEARRTVEQLVGYIDLTSDSNEVVWARA